MRVMEADIKVLVLVDHCLLNTLRVVSLDIWWYFEESVAV